MSNANKDAALFDSLEDLFESDIDDLADLASFETPPKGAYVCTVTTIGKQINDKPAVEATFTVVETVELEDSNAIPVAVGTKFSTMYSIGNEVGIGKLKEFLKPFAAHYGTGKLGDLVRDHIKETSVSLTMKHRKDKTDPEKVYADVRNITVA